MDSKQIRELIELISSSDFSTFEMEQDGFKLKLVRGGGAAAPAAAPVADAGAEPAPPIQAAAQPAPAPEPEPAAPAEPVEDGLIDMNCPIIGTFYIAPSPDAAPFVEVGSKIKKGQVICIVEAMKVMNEIEAEINAEVVEIRVANGQPVEYGEVLFRLRPT